MRSRSSTRPKASVLILLAGYPGSRASTSNRHPDTAQTATDSHDRARPLSICRASYLTEIVGFSAAQEAAEETRACRTVAGAQMKATASLQNTTPVLLAQSYDAGSGDTPRRGVTESDDTACSRRRCLQARRDERNRGHTTASTIGIACKASRATRCAGAPLARYPSHAEGIARSVGTPVIAFVEKRSPDAACAHD